MVRHIYHYQKYYEVGNLPSSKACSWIPEEDDIAGTDSIKGAQKWLGNIPLLLSFMEIIVNVAMDSV